MVIGTNLTFGPMHILGLQGQPRRMYRYAPDRIGEGFFDGQFWNLVATIGSLIIALSVLLFIINIVITVRQPANAPLDPWDAAEPRVDDDQSAEAAQLRRHPDRPLTRRVLPPQVRRGRRHWRDQADRDR